MKKYVIFALAGVMICSCNKEGSVENDYSVTKNPIVFVANADNSVTKTVLGSDGVKVNWIAGDMVAIYGEAEGDPAVGVYMADEIQGRSCVLYPYSSVSFGEYDNPQYAIYPPSVLDSPAEESFSSEGVIEFILPDTQYYSKNSFGNGANVAVGKVTSNPGDGTINDISFKNVCGYLRLKLSVGYGESLTIGKIVLSAKGEESLFGTFTVDATSDTPTAVYDTEVDDGDNFINLDCGEGVELTADPTEFYFVLPAGTLEHGFEAVLYNGAGDCCGFLETEKELTIARNTVRAMQNKNIDEE